MNLSENAFCDRVIYLYQIMILESTALQMVTRGKNPVESLSWKRSFWVTWFTHSSPPLNISVLEHFFTIYRSVVMMEFKETH